MPVKGLSLLLFNLKVMVKRLMSRDMLLLIATKENDNRQFK